MKRIFAIVLNLLLLSTTYISADNGSRTSCVTYSSEEHKEMLVKAFIRKMYDEKLFEDSEFLQEHCSDELLTKLQKANDMDGEGYATWLFRSGQQDEKPAAKNETKILEISSDGDDWYTYRAMDNGWEFSKLIKVIVKNKKVIITDIQNE